MMQVICFYWEGERWQEKQDLSGEFSKFLRQTGTVSHSLATRYINNLYYGIKRFAAEDFKFICFTNLDLDLDKNIETRQFPLFTDKGVLPRLWMFSKGAGLFGDQVLCLDIDVVITGSLQDIMGYRGNFCARGKFINVHKLDGDIMSFRANEENEQRFWKPFRNDIEAAEEFTKGRERYWLRHVANDIADKWQELIPGQIVSYKRHVRRNKALPENARIVSFHGIPRPHRASDKWIKNYWQ